MVKFSSKSTQIPIDHKANRAKVMEEISDFFFEPILDELEGSRSDDVVDDGGKIAASNGEGTNEDEGVVVIGDASVIDEAIEVDQESGSEPVEEFDEFDVGDEVEIIGESSDIQDVDDETPEPIQNPLSGIGKKPNRPEILADEEFASDVTVFDIHYAAEMQDKILKKYYEVGEVSSQIAAVISEMAMLEKHRDELSIQQSASGRQLQILKQEWMDRFGTEFSPTKATQRIRSIKEDDFADNLIAVSAIDPGESNEDWTSTPIQHLQLDRVRGLGSKKIKAIEHRYPTIGELRDAINDTTENGLTSIAGVGNRLVDSIESLYVEWLKKNQP